ncbi:hypothetical protein PCI56_03245 [Plesiomonas shigelloides subsp. oncorhynchi]|nr:hypothetical protein [Plesiomonas shigelloides]
MYRFNDRAKKTLADENDKQNRFNYLALNAFCLDCAFHFQIQLFAWNTEMVGGFSDLAGKDKQRIF